MVDSHTQTHDSRSLPPELHFACWLPPIVLASWVILVVAISAWNLEVASLALLAGTIASAFAPIGLFIAIRAIRLPHPADERPAIIFALIGNALVVVQIVAIIAVPLSR